jgi:hypothetical protein
MIAAAAAYFTNLFIAVSSFRKERRYEEPFLQATPKSVHSLKLGEIWRRVGIIAMVISIVCFGVGLMVAQSAFGNLSSAKKPVTVQPLTDVWDAPG